MDITRHLPGFFEMFVFDGLMIVRKAENSTVVHALHVGTGDGEKDRSDLDIAGVLGAGKRIFEAGACLHEIRDLTFSNTCGFGDTDAENLYGTVRFDLANNDTGFACADFQSDMNFGAACHEVQLRFKRD